MSRAAKEEPARFADDLRAEMTARGLRSEHVAVETGVSAATVYAWLGGKLPDYIHYLRVCRMFGWPHRELDSGRKKGTTRAWLDALHPDSPDQVSGPLCPSPSEDFFELAGTA